MLPSIKKIIISIFVTMNIVAVLYSNKPGFISTISNKFVNGCFSKVAATNIHYMSNFIENKIRWYAYLVGLNNHWIMFSFQPRYNWWYRIKAKYENSEIVLLPLPRQSKRTFWQKIFFDFKEAKLEHNLYGNKKRRDNYANYLCRTFKIYKNSKIDSIIWELHSKSILPPKEACIKGMYMGNDEQLKNLDIFSCKELTKQ